MLGALIWLLLPTPAAHASACAAQNDYREGGGGSWSTAANWSQHKLPSSAESVCIPAGDGTIAIEAGVKAEVKTILAQSEVTIAPSATLAISETFAMEDPKLNEEQASRFTDLTIAGGGTLSTAGDWIFMSGTVLLEGEITSTNKSEDVARLLSGTLSGNGTVDISFSNIAGTLEPGGAGAVGELHFTSLSSQGAAGTLVLDIESGVAFDRLADLTSNFFLGGTLEINLLGAYEPAVGTKWEFMSKGPGDSTEFTTIEPSAFTARSVSGGSEVELLTAPPTVLTQAASLVAATSATLNGAVNPNGVRISACEFEYGTTAAYGSLVSCTPLPGEGRSAREVSAAVTNLTSGTTYHFRVVATNAGGTREGADETFTTPSVKGSEPPAEEVQSKEKPAQENPTNGGGSSSTGNPSSGGTTLTTVVGVPAAPGEEIPAAAIASTPRAVEEVLLGCTKSKLVLNDVYISAGHVVLSGSTAKSLTGKRVEILLDAGKRVASATVHADGQYVTSAPLPLVKGRVALGARYAAQIGGLRSLNLKLTRRLQLEPPKVSDRTVTLVGQVELPLTKPIAAVSVEQQLKCGKTAIVKTFTPPASGRFDISLTVPAGASAGLFRLKSSVAANEHSTAHGFATYSLPLPALLG